MKDLLGGDYWVDIDKFAERDMGGLNPIPYQNDMEYYEKYWNYCGTYERTVYRSSSPTGRYGVLLSY